MCDHRAYMKLCGSHWCQQDINRERKQQLPKKPAVCPSSLVWNTSGQATAVRTCKTVCVF